MLKMKLIEAKGMIKINDSGNGGIQHWINVYGSKEEVKNVFGKILERLRYLDKKANIKINTETTITIDPNILRQNDLDIINILNQELVGYNEISEVFILRKKDEENTIDLGGGFNE